MGLQSVLSLHGQGAATILSNDTRRISTLIRNHFPFDINVALMCVGVTHSPFALPACTLSAMNVRRYV